MTPAEIQAAAAGYVAAVSAGLTTGGILFGSVWAVRVLLRFISRDHD